MKKFIKFRTEVADYSHQGDLSHEESYLKNIFPDAKDFNSWEERDYERESDYKSEYGESEYFYKGFVEFMAPEKIASILEDYNCYPVNEA